jgi:hypothetical protein
MVDMAATLYRRLVEDSLIAALVSRLAKAPQHLQMFVGLMSWASRYIEKLRAGETVSFRPHGHSMTGRIESGQLCTVVPIDPATLEVARMDLAKLDLWKMR